MSLSGNFAKRALAIGAASALGLGGLLVASPAAAASDAPQLDGEAVAAVAQELVAANDAIQGAAIDADGNLVVVAVASDADERAAVEATVTAEGQADPANILYLDAPFESAAATDVVGGAGYFGWNSVTGQGGLCSVGFSAWSPTGDDAIITAGHCQNDLFDSLALTVPTGDPAGGGASNNDDIEPYAAIGAFGFHQFGGPGDVPGAQGDLNAIDIAVIDVTNGALNLKPAVTDWSNTADLSASASNITRVGSAVAGQSASKSGRTTGVTSGTIDLVNGSISVDGQFVHGFAVMGALTIPGDSGGAVYSGSTALGVTSATATLNGVPLTWASDLTNALPYTGGYTVKLFVAAPVVTTASGADVERGTNVTGTGPAGATIVVTPAGGTAFEVQTDASGAWSFPAPSTLGAYSFSVQAKSGEFDTSDTVSSSINVVPAPLLAPVITAPANGAQLTSDVTTLTGTGLPGAVVSVTGDATGTATVAGNGTFSVTLSAPLSLGAHSLTVTQASEGQTSPAATTAFSVVPVSPAVTTPAPGSSFPLADAPSEVSGTGIDGATVTVSVDGIVIGDVVVVDGVWTYVLPAALTAGTHTITVTQAIDGVSSAAVTSTVTVVAPVVTPPTDPAGNGGNGLANTGVEPLGFIGGAAALLLAGGLVLAIRRRSSVTE